MNIEELIKSVEKYSQNLKGVIVALKTISKEESDVNKRLILLGKERKKIEKFLNESNNVEINEKIQTVLKNVSSEMQDLEGSVKTKFGSELNALLQENGFKLEGNYPLLKTSFYTIELDFTAKKANIYYGPKIERIASSSSVPEDVAKTLIKEHGRITQRPFNDVEFIRTMFQAYQNVVSQMNKPIGTELSIQDFLPALSFSQQTKKFYQDPKKSNYTEYDRIFFSYDLSRLKARRIERFELRLVSATRNDTKNQYGFIWTPKGPATTDGEAISRIKFVEVS